MNTPPVFAGRDHLQQAWVVADLATAMRHWIEICGVGPFFVIEKVAMENLTYRGAPARIDCTIGVAQVRDRGQLLTGPVTVADGIERQGQLAGLGSGHPRMVGDAADPQAPHDELVPALLQSLAA